MEARDALAKWERDGLISGELAATLYTTLEVDEK